MVPSQPRSTAVQFRLRPYGHLFQCHYLFYHTAVYRLWQFWLISVNFGHFWPQKSLLSSIHCHFHRSKVNLNFGTSISCWFNIVVDQPYDIIWYQLTYVLYNYLKTQVRNGIKTDILWIRSEIPVRYPRNNLGTRTRIGAKPVTRPRNVQNKAEILKYFQIGDKL